MNIGFFKRPKLHSVLTALFFAGIVISSGALYLLPADFSEEKLWQTYLIVGLTFLAGIISVNLTARSKKQTVVYLEKRQENKTTDQAVKLNLDGQVNIQPIRKIIEERDDAPQRVINELCKQLQAGQGAIYVTNSQQLELKYGYALSRTKGTSISYEWGEGLVGRVAAEGQTLYIDKLPEGYITVFSGLGAGSPSHLVIVPVKNESGVKGVMEIATFSEVNPVTRQQIEHAGQALAEVIF